MCDRCVVGWSGRVGGRVGVPQGGVVGWGGRVGVPQGGVGGWGGVFDPYV